MSVKVMTLVWGWSLPATEKLVALKLADCADDRGLNSFPAVATIAADCGLTDRGARKVLARLRDRGCIEIQAPATNRKSTTYRVVLAFDRPEPGSGLGGNVVPLQTGTTFRPGGNDVPPRPEHGSGLDLNHVQPIRQGSVRDPSRAYTRARDGRRPHPLDEAPVLAPEVVELFDQLYAAYPRKERRVDAERAWLELNLSREQAALVVASVRMRVAAGWVDHVGGRQYVPQLWRFLEGRRWTEPERTSESSGGRDGMLVMKSCPTCGETVEGRVVSGAPVYDPCSRCVVPQRATL